MDEALSVSFFVIICVVLYACLIRWKNYWRYLDVPHVGPLPIFGNLRPLMLLQKSPGPFLGELYNAPAALGQRFLGFFLFNCEPALLIRDPKLVKRILVQDFDHFHNRNVECDPFWDPMGARNLFVARDAKWKYLRTKLSPTFTSGKMRHMFLLIKELASDLGKIIEEGIASETEPPPVEVKELIAKYTTDVINSCAFGIRSDCMRNPNSRFRYFGKKVFNTGVKRSLETRAFFFMHWLANKFRFVFFEKESSKFMANLFAEILREREKSLAARNDFVDVLIKLKRDVQQMKGEESAELRELDEETVLAQAALFYTAGFETTSVTIMFLLYELAIQPEIQQRLRREIVDSLQANGGNLDYDSLFNMKYLDMAVSETLRMYPPMAFVDRICTKDYPIPDSNVVVRKGTPVFISLYKGLHHDADYFPGPYRFDPDRFGGVEKADMEPYSYLPFGAGPHICLGMRFGLMNTKTAICILLSKYRVEPCARTQMPEICPRSIILNPKRDLFLKFVPLKSEAAA